MNIDEAQPMLETVRRDAHYAEYRFFLTRPRASIPNVLASVAHVGYKLTTMPGAAAICGVQSTRCIDVRGEDRLCYQCEKALESLYNIVRREEADAPK